MDAEEASPKTAELTAIIREIQDRVRARYPMTGASGIPLPDLMPVVHARDAAEAKVGAIGMVNPRPPGLANSIVQSVKRLVARTLYWHVREQVEFNRAAMSCVEAILEALNDSRRSIAALASELEAQKELVRRYQEEAVELKDIRAHWSTWREEWERKLTVNEVQFLRSVADLQAGFHHRAEVLESNFRDSVRAQHTEFGASLDKTAAKIQKTMWEDIERIRGEYERLIHSELRTVRQRASALAPLSVSAANGSSATPSSSPPAFDYLRFAERFRGTEEYVQRGQALYLPHFRECRSVLDIGCGRGEFLSLLRDAGVPARGIDLGEESVAICRAKGLEAEVADLFLYLDRISEGSLDGIFCAQVVEHLAPESLPRFIALAQRALSRGGLLVIETPNPECLAIFATHFYLDPTHTRPVPPGLIAFYLEEAGFGRLRVERLAPAIESMPSLAELPDRFRQTFFGALDYAVFARRL